MGVIIIRNSNNLFNHPRYSRNFYRSHYRKRSFFFNKVTITHAPTEIRALVNAAFAAFTTSPLVPTAIYRRSFASQTGLNVSRLVREFSNQDGAFFLSWVGTSFRFSTFTAVNCSRSPGLPSSNGFSSRCWLLRSLVKGIYFLYGG